MSQRLTQPFESAPSNLSARWWVVMGILAIVLLGVGETSLRQAGFQSGPHDDDVFWAFHRQQVERLGEDGIVCLGSSRSQADIRITQLSERVGRPVVQLAIAGSSPLPVLEDLARRSDFHGLIMVSVTPYHAFSDRAERTGKSHDWIRRYHKIESSPGERLELRINVIARQSVLLRQDFNWRTVVNRYLIGGQTPYKEVFTKETRWTHFPDVMKRRRRGFEFEDPDADQDRTSRDALIRRYTVAIKTIEQRGGEVILIRPPSTGENSMQAGLIDTEKQLFPRALFFDRLVRESGVDGFHSEDFAETKDLYGVDGSHLCNSDARRFTRWLADTIEDLR